MQAVLSARAGCAEWGTDRDFIALDSTDEGDYDDENSISEKQALS